MDEITEESGSTTSLKRQINHEEDKGANGDDAADSPPKRPKLSEDSQVTNHKTFSEADPASLNGAIAKLSDSVNDVERNSIIHSQETVKPNSSPTIERTLPSNGEGLKITATDSAGDVQTSKEGKDPQKEEDHVNENNENTRTLTEENTSEKDCTEKEISNEVSAKEDAHSEKGDGDGKGEEEAEEHKVPMETSTANCNQTSEDSNVSKGQEKEPVSLPSTKIKCDHISQGQEIETSSSTKEAKIGLENKDKHRSSSLEEQHKRQYDFLVKKPEKEPHRSRKDGSGRGILNSTIDPVKGDELAEEETMEDEGVEMGGMIGGNGQRMTRSRTRKAKGIEEAPPKSIYVELSDDSDYSEDSPPVSPWIDPLSKLSPELLKQRETSTKLLREALRVQESKLLFLKKVKQNQQQPVFQQASTNHPPTNLSQNRVVLQTLNSAAPSNPQLHLQPNRGRPTIGKPGFPASQQHIGQRQQMPLLIRGSTPQGTRNVQSGHSGPPPLLLVHDNKNTHSGQISQNRSAGQHQMARQHTVQNNSLVQKRPGIHVTNQQIAHQQNRTVSNSAPVPEPQSAASRQAAAKLALRKQLEKTLLQIPPPKPPPPELHFLPSAANSEFIILVGLEEVVNTILNLGNAKKEKDKESPKFLEPFRCAQCKTDFTTIWKHDPKQGIMCEACIVSNQKRALKAEHTNRLKTAFVKALQQEQEIEQRMQQSQQSKPAQAHVVHLDTKVADMRRHQTIIAQATRSMYNMSNQSVPSVRRVLNPPPPVSQQQQQQQQQRVVNSYQYLQHLHPGASSGQIPMLTKQINSVYRMSTTSDRQREYLLDMIPSKGLAQQTIVWKR